MMLRLISILLLAWATTVAASPADDQIDLHYFPPAPEKVEPAKLPTIAPGLTSGMPFFKVRKIILANGWKPLNLRKDFPHEEPDCGLLDCELHRRGVLEVAGCPTDVPVCTFYYRKGQSWLQLMTFGEEMPKLSVYYWAAQPPEPRKTAGEITK